MKISSFSKFVGAGVVAASLAVLPLTVPANAQNSAPNTYNAPDAEVETADTDNDFDWGWLGLLGLAGLAGLAGKKRHETVHTHHVSSDPNVRVRSESNYR